MKFIIFICTRIRHGQYPRLPDFQYSEKLGKYIYQGRELTLEEFNAAALVVFDQNYRANGYNFAPMAIAAVEEVAPAPVVAPVTDPVAPVEDPAVQPTGGELKFILTGKSIFLDGVRVGGLYGEEKQLRVVEDFQDLRPQIETFIQSLPQ